LKRRQRDKRALSEVQLTTLDNRDKLYRCGGAESCRTARWV